MKFRCCFLSLFVAVSVSLSGLAFAQSDDIHCPIGFTESRSTFSNGTVHISCTKTGGSHTLPGVTITAAPDKPKNGYASTPNPLPPPSSLNYYGSANLTPTSSDFHCENFNPIVEGNVAASYSTCWEDVKDEQCLNNLKSVVDGIAQRCKFTGAFLQNEITRKNIILFVDGPGTQNTFTDALSSLVLAVSIPQLVQGVASTLPSRVIGLSKAALTYDCSNFRIEYASSGDTLETTLIHEALHIILNTLHNSPVGAHIEEYANASDCGESQWASVVQ